MIRDCFRDRPDGVGVEDFNADGEVSAELRHSAQDIQRAGVPVNDRSLDIILLQEIQDFFLRVFGMQINHLFLFPRSGEKIFQYF